MSPISSSSSTSSSDSFESPTLVTLLSSTSTTMSANTSAAQRSLLVLKHGEQRVLIPRPRTLSVAIDAACRYFPGISKDAVKLQTQELDVCGGHLADITVESWPLVINLINLIEVTQSASPVTPPVTYQPIPSTLRRTSREMPRLRKPVIYLYSPADIDVSVHLSLSPEWRFSVIYPVVNPKQNGGEHIEWNVRTHQDGNLTEKNTELEVSYLFWEAEVIPGAPPSPPRSPAFGQPESVEYFNPASSDLCDTNSVLLSVDKVTPYLDKSLQVLGLHTEARTSFITYWLPSMLKYKYIALRFIPQSAYERAAPLEISPRPDITTRIFMIFKGVGEDQLADWSDARAMAEKDVAWWGDVVGVELARTSDPTLFRVLEWGGMEVLKV